MSAREMVLKIKTALLCGDALTVTVEVDGQQVSFSRPQAIEELKFWQREAAKEANLRPRVARIRLDS